MEPKGNYDTIEITLQILSTTSDRYFLNNTLTREECSLNQTEPTIRNVSLIELQDLIYRTNFKNLCPMSNYNASLIVKRDGFEPVETFLPIRTSISKSESKKLVFFYLM
jgi:hypothetical protein